MKYDVNDLAEMLRYKRPDRSKTEEEFIRFYIDSVYGMQHDSFGNRYIKIGTSDTAFASHTDTVHHSDGKQEVYIDPKGIAHTQSKLGGPVESKFTYTQETMKPLSKNQMTLPIHRVGADCLGADDTTGVWIMLNMIHAHVPGLYIFHRSEERGGQGSQHIKKTKLLKNYTKVIGLDRRAFNSIITHQGGTRCCSDEFAKALGKALGWYQIDTTGVFTDTANYVGIVPECTNLSVGYQHEHTPNETQDLVYAESLLHAMVHVHWNQLPVIRKAQIEKKYYDNFGSEFGGWDNSTQSWATKPKEFKKKKKKKSASAITNNMDWPEDSWECPYCHQMNPADYQTCWACETPHKSIETYKQAGKWWPETPTALLDKKTEDTKVKTITKNDFVKGTSQDEKTKGTWKCKECGHKNYKDWNPRFCAICQAPRKKKEKTNPFQNYDLGRDDWAGVK